MYRLYIETGLRIDLVKPYLGSKPANTDRYHMLVNLVVFALMRANYLCFLFNIYSDCLIS